jgi:hypothetical protein
VPPELPNDEYRLNEPDPGIPGGRERKSVKVDRARVPDIARRERVSQLLVAHDPETVKKNWEKLGEEDLALVRLIAREGALAGTPPAVRRNAIVLLGERPTGENLNVLEELARRGEDIYTRSAALVALGRTGLGAVAPILAEGLRAPDPIEATAAERGVIALGRSLGESGLRAVFHGDRRKAVLAGLERALKQLAQEGKPRRPRPKRQRAVSDDANH